MPVYAHTLEGQPEERWELLETHLRAVADLAERFCAEFGAGEWGRLAGLWHDLGKYLPDFQAMLRGERVQVEHAGLGAALAYRNHAMASTPLAFAIAGHHSGLANRQVQGESDLTPLMERLARNAGLLDGLFQELPAWVRDPKLPPFPDWLNTAGRRDDVYQDVEMFTRFVFSALVDADRLCTEAFCRPNERPSPDFSSMDVLRDRLDAHVDALAAVAVPSPVSRARAEVLAWCREHAASAPGVFSLTVPTGGGKTLSAMAFALRHAVCHGKRRVIVVIPFTSIIEQNARVYRSALGAASVVEHHSNFDEEVASEANGEREIQRRLATENWDAPIIVTTTVQFFETLFSNHPSRCRKLHNVANSVLVLDEVQTLPPWLINPILSGLRQLTAQYRCSVVLCTATQPSLTSTGARPQGLRDVREIVPNPTQLSRRLNRVRVTNLNLGQPTPYVDIVPLVVAHERVLVVVHLRRDARTLAAALPVGGRYHLSALMCSDHRSSVLQEVHEGLRRRQPCRLVATQLVEAGVDIDFPVVFRTLAGVDSLAQAAGRCNREGALRDAEGAQRPGDFIVFRAETEPPRGVLRIALDVSSGLLASHGGSLDVGDPTLHREFFDRLYWLVDGDNRNVQRSRAGLDFADVARSFSIIDDYTIPVVVPWADSADRLSAYRRWPSRRTRRALQPFVVQITPVQRQHLASRGALEVVDRQLHVLTPPFESLYSKVFGLDVESDAGADPAALMA
jgi:CRISPR-associated endonuclease/helicase Cas3